MRKLLSMVLIAIMAMGTATAGEKTIHPSKLPATVTTFIKKNFKKDIHHAREDRGTFGLSGYDIILTDGTELEFNEDGALKEVNCGTKAVPDAVIPASIRDYVKRYYPKDKIVEMEIKRSGYDIKLHNGLEIEFDQAGRFRRIDD